MLSDADLFKACGGRTAHKGARHGLNLSGKLQRVAEQERLLLEKMKGKQNKHEVFREPYTKKRKAPPLVELNSSKEEMSDDTLPVDTESDYILKSKKKQKHDKKEELQLVTKINAIGLDEEKKAVEEVPDEPYNGTPTRKKKKSKRVTEMLSSIREIEPSSDSSTPKRPKKKKKKGKRKLDEGDESMADQAEKYLKDKPVKAKKVKLDDSYEASADEDVADRVNAEQEDFHLRRALKKGRKAKKKTTESATGIAFELWWNETLAINFFSLFIDSKYFLDYFSTFIMK